MSSISLVAWKENNACQLTYEPNVSLKEFKHSPFRTITLHNFKLVVFLDVNL